MTDKESKKKENTKKSPKMANKPKNLVLDHYHCTLFLPLIGLEKSGLKPIIEKHSYTTFNQEEGASYYYFSPAIRNILYDKGGDKGSDKGSIKEWRLPDSIIQDWVLCLDNSKAPEWSAVKQNQYAKITSVKLLQYFNGLYLLAIRLEPKALLELKKIKYEEPSEAPFEKVTNNTLEEFNQIDPENAHLYQELIMEDWMHFSRLIRLIYPSFTQQTNENKIAPITLLSVKKEKEKEKEIVTAFETPIKRDDIKHFQRIGENFSPVICEILTGFFNEKTRRDISNIIKKYVEFYDDRMFVSIAYGIAGDQLPQKDLERINSLASYVDRQEADGWEDKLQGYAYTQNITKEKIDQQSYALWQGLGGYYTFTNFSNSYLNRGKDFRDFIATEHIPHIYDRMLIQALFYQASLRHYDNQICDSTKQLLEKGDIQSIKKQRSEFIQFTNQYWFHKLTEQMQGEEIFKLQQQGLKLQEHYDILKDELERTDEYLQTEQEIKENKFNTNIGLYGFWFAFIALYYTILPIINNYFKDISDTKITLWKKLAEWCYNVLADWQMLIISVLLPPVVLCIIYIIYKIKK